MKDLTSDQQKVIDLINTRKLTNLQLALDLNRAENLGIENIYLELYQKWDCLFDIDDEDNEAFKAFPVESLLMPNHPFLDFFELCIEDKKDSLSIICECIRDLMNIAGVPASSISIRFEDKTKRYDYLRLNEVQEVIINSTPLSKRDIDFRFNLEDAHGNQMPF